MLPKIANVVEGEDCLQITWQISWQSSQKHKNQFSYVWLRDHCRDAESFDGATHQRKTYTAGVSENIRPMQVSVSSCGSILNIQWPDLSQPTHYSTELLTESPKSDIGVNLWGAGQKPIASLDISAIADDSSLSKLLLPLKQHGFVLLQGCDTNEHSVRAIANRIGYVRQTIFGDVWSFEANQQMADSAYSSETLRPHTDGTYSLDAPGLQLLLCTHREATGGESVLVDGFAVLDALRHKDPDLFNALTRISVPGIYRGDGKVLRASRPIIRLGPEDEVQQVSFNNYDRDVLRLSNSDEALFYKGLRALEARFNSTDWQWRRVLDEGEMLIFDNWRMLHGRDSFEGSRKMMGCYINREDYLSALEGLEA